CSISRFDTRLSRPQTAPTHRSGSRPPEIKTSQSRAVLGPIHGLSAKNTAAEMQFPARGEPDPPYAWQRPPKMRKDTYIQDTSTCLDNSSIRAIVNAFYKKEPDFYTGLNKQPLVAWLRLPICRPGGQPRNDFRFRA